jgi:hypothetical protein
MTHPSDLHPAKIWWRGNGNFAAAHAARRRWLHPEEPSSPRTAVAGSSDLVAACSLRAGPHRCTHYRGGCDHRVSKPRPNCARRGSVVTLIRRPQFLSSEAGQHVGLALINPKVWIVDLPMRWRLGKLYQLFRKLLAYGSHALSRPPATPLPSSGGLEPLDPSDLIHPEETWRPIDRALAAVRTP